MIKKRVKDMENEKDIKSSKNNDCYCSCYHDINSKNITKL